MQVHPQEFSLVNVFIANRMQLWRIARRIVMTADLADDVLQDSFLRIAEGTPARLAEKPFNYCCQIVRNMALDYCRRHRTESCYRTFDIDVEAVEMPSDQTPCRSLSERQVVLAIDKVLSELPPRTRMVFELYRIEGMTQRQIAERCDCALGLVNALISDATAAISSCADLLE